MNLTMLNQDKGITQSEMAKEVARIHGKMVLARQFPRNVDECIEKILKECERPKVAEDAAYEYPRGGTLVYGPSIRITEVVAQNWQNMDFGVRELSQSAGESEMQAFAWDLETNVSKEITFTVKHGRYSSSKGFKEFGENSDPREIYETTANFAARRMRNCIQSTIPQWVFEAALQKCEETLKSLVKDPQEAIKNMQKEFAKWGIIKAHIEELIKKPVSKAKVTDILRLRRIYKSIKDHIGAPSQFFNVPAEVDKKAGFKESTAGNDGNEDAGSVKDKLNEKLKEKNGEKKGENKNQDQTERTVTEQEIEALIMFANKMDKETREKFMKFWNDREAQHPADWGYWYEKLLEIKQQKEK